MAASEPGQIWGSCRYCGTAVAPGATVCGLCGADRPVPAAALPKAPVGVRRRISFFNWLRMIVMVGVSVALGWALISAVASGPPVVADPLDTSGSYVVPVGSTAIFDGNITGGDYIVGNFTSTQPLEANVTVSAYTYSGWLEQVQNGTGSPVWSTPSEGVGRIVFSPEVTNDYMFVLTNNYPASTHLVIHVYVTTQYESNVGDDGFG
jgi:hypothetical protein